MPWKSRDVEPSIDCPSSPVGVRAIFDCGSEPYSPNESRYVVDGGRWRRPTPRSCGFARFLTATGGTKCRSSCAAASSAVCVVFRFDSDVKNGSRSSAGAPTFGGRRWPVCVTFSGYGFGASPSSYASWKVERAKNGRSRSSTGRRMNGGSPTGRGALLSHSLFGIVAIAKLAGVSE